MFQLICLTEQRKFLSSTKCLRIEDVMQQVARLLTYESIATVSIRRLKEKESAGEAAH